MLFHNYRFTSEHPGTVFVKTSADGAEQPFVLFRGSSGCVPQNEPVPIPPPGLDGQRQEYLYRHIREFVEDECKDTLCPQPGSVFPLTTQPCRDDVQVQESSDEKLDSDNDLSDDDSLECETLRPRAKRGRTRGRGLKQAGKNKNDGKSSGVVENYNPADDGSESESSRRRAKRGKTRGRSVKEAARKNNDDNSSATAEVNCNESMNVRGGRGKRRGRGRRGGY